MHHAIQLCVSTSNRCCGSLGLIANGEEHDASVSVAAQELLICCGDPCGSDGSIYESKITARLIGPFLRDYSVHVASSSCRNPADCESLAADGDMSAGDFRLR